MQKGGFIYIMTNKNKTTLYIGITNDLQRRVWEHRTYYDKSSFTAKYNLENCIYYECFQNIEHAIQREKQLKKWNRAKKELLINSMNPAWNDLWEEISMRMF
jgi:putative endonuclease